MTRERTWTTCRLMLVPPRSGAENMARDVALMERARHSGEMVFSVYEWKRPTLSFGRNQKALGSYSPTELEKRGIDVVRRPTGGRALLHHREVTYSVTAAIEENESLRESYARINRILLQGLLRMGVAVRESVRDSPSLRPGDTPCFAAPAEGELVTRDGKLVGSAQVRENGALLQHGSILIEDDQTLIAELLGATTGEILPTSAATLSSVLGRSPPVAEVADNLFTAVRELECATASPLPESEVSGAVSRHIERFESEWWTWRT